MPRWPSVPAWESITIHPPREQLMSNVHPADQDPTPAAPFGALEGTHWIETLSDGSPVLIRPLRPDDRQRETDFIQRLSEQACRFRFLGNLKQASPALLDQLMDVDARDRMAFVALAHDNGELREVGVSRDSSGGKKTQCDCAVKVDAEIGRGPGR